MPRTFQNPANDHLEIVGPGASFGAFFLGWIYLAFKGLWGHFFAWFVVVGAGCLIVDPYSFILTIPLLSIFYGLAIQQILATRFLRRGWREVAEKSDASTAISTTTAHAPQTEAQPPAPLAGDETKSCPYCAETIKAAAIRCKHCQADLSTSAETTPRGVAP